jgi:hypothetical protein
MQNKEIREAARQAGVKLWQIADALGMTDGNFSRKLRHELTEGQKEKVYAIIAKLSSGVIE